MATKSFQTDYSFNTKSSSKLIEAMEKSKRVTHKITQPVEQIRSKEEVNIFISSLLARK
ncbi:hypothetical protein [Lapidilactobacillus gannanensis]|uniref:Uncharacterized protein n=1 Tax=Lapidilactobacillus gannanensis TaxID=2486002 RepID=A0ABW4BQQ6_9LACO|nr:hypothetical protein [Lapidilactobacillus gannanensis]